MYNFTKCEQRDTNLAWCENSSNTVPERLSFTDSKRRNNQPEGCYCAILHTQLLARLTTPMYVGLCGDRIDGHKLGHIRQRGSLAVAKRGDVRR